MSTYYNENDPRAAEWLRELIADGAIAPGVVDERSIVDVRAEDLDGYERAHFFAGMGCWDSAMLLASFPTGVRIFSGSCPCQPFSCAGNQRGHRDERHLWPEFYRLIEACRPQAVVGEQVASSEVLGTDVEADFLESFCRGEHARANRLAHRLSRTSGFHFHRRWLDGISANLEAIGYAMRPVVLGAHSAGAPHIRQRLFWGAVRVVNDSHIGHQRSWESRGRRAGPADSGADGGMGDMHDARSQERVREPGVRRREMGSPERQATERGGDPCWRSVLHRCSDGKSRRVPAIDAESRFQPLAHDGQRHGEALARGRQEGDGEGEGEKANTAMSADPDLWPLAPSEPGRVGLLRGAGNAILPHVAAMFVRAFGAAVEERTKEEQ